MITCKVCGARECFPGASCCPKCGVDLHPGSSPAIVGDLVAALEDCLTALTQDGMHRATRAVAIHEARALLARVKGGA